MTNIAISSNTETLPDISDTNISLSRVLVALDQSDYANQAMREITRLAASANGTVTGIHAYAAKLHDRRFKQMEGGLPEKYQRESEMEHQREVPRRLDWHGAWPDI